MTKIPVGLVLQASNEAAKYVYVGSRPNKALNTEHIFVRVVEYHWPDAKLRVYRAVNPDTLVTKFPDLARWPVEK